MSHLESSLGKVVWKILSPGVEGSRVISMAEGHLPFCFCVPWSFEILFSLWQKSKILVCEPGTTLGCLCVCMCVCVCLSVCGLSVMCMDWMTGTQSLLEDLSSSGLTGRDRGQARQRIGALVGSPPTGPGINCLSLGPSSSRKPGVFWGCGCQVS